mmetsp:Transcript_116459/g.276823  ORF Transcript_116459/g.276823 Transcript_116459/m.276823 type:complete len:260 (-) Transcript_116459:289-1068(-)
MMTQLLVGEHHHGAPFRREAVLVGIAGDGRDPRHPEVEGRDVEARLLHERNQEATKTTINMKTNLLLQGDLAHFLDGIHSAVAVLAAGAHNGHGIGVHQLHHAFQVHPHVLVRRHLPDINLEVLSRLVEGSVRRGAHHDVGIRDALGGAPVAVRLHGHENALRAAGGEGPAGIRTAVVHVDNHLHHLGVHLAKRRMEIRMQRVAEGPLGKDLADEVVVLLTAVVDRTCCLALHPGLTVLLLPVVQEFQEVLLGHALAGQ